MAHNGCSAGGSALGRRYADILAQVWRLDGEETWVLVHVEVQGQPQDEFAERMYVYNYRLYDRYRRPVASLAVLADEQAGWRLGEFSMAPRGPRKKLALTGVIFCGILILEVRLVTPGDSGHLRWSSFRRNSGRTD